MPLSTRKLYNNYKVLHFQTWNSVRKNFLLPILPIITGHRPEKVLLRKFEILVLGSEYITSIYASAPLHCQIRRDTVRNTMQWNLDLASRKLTTAFSEGHLKLPLAHLLNATLKTQEKLLHLVYMAAYKKPCVHDTMLHNISSVL